MYKRFEERSLYWKIFLLEVFTKNRLVKRGTYMSLIRLFQGKSLVRGMWLTHLDQEDSVRGVDDYYSSLRVIFSNVQQFSFVLLVQECVGSRMVRKVRVFSSSRGKGPNVLSIYYFKRKGCWIFSFRTTKSHSFNKWKWDRFVFSIISLYL